MSDTLKLFIYLYFIFYFVPVKDMHTNENLPHMHAVEWVKLLAHAEKEAFTDRTLEREVRAEYSAIGPSPTWLWLILMFVEWGPKFRDLVISIRSVKYSTQIPKVKREKVRYCGTSTKFCLTWKEGFFSKTINFIFIKGHKLAIQQNNYMQESC